MATLQTRQNSNFGLKKLIVPVIGATIVGIVCSAAERSTGGGISWCGWVCRSRSSISVGQIPVDVEIIAGIHVHTFDHVVVASLSLGKVEAIGKGDKDLDKFVVLGWNCKRK